MRTLISLLEGLTILILGVTLGGLLALYVAPPPQCAQPQPVEVHLSCNGRNK